MQMDTATAAIRLMLLETDGMAASLVRYGMEKFSQY